METITYRTIDGLDLQADIHAPEGDLRPVIFWIHGGALIGGSRNGPGDWQRKLYHDWGYALVSIDYRLAPETKLPGIIGDVRAAWDWLHNEAPGRFAVDPSRTAVVGHSAGGYLTLMTGFCVEPRPSALVSFYGYGDIIGPWYSEPDPFYCRQDAVPESEARAAVQDRPLPNSDGTTDRGRFYLWCRQNGRWPIEVAGFDPSTDPDAFIPYSPVQNVTADYPPTLLLHGQQDTDVPHDLSAMMDAELARVGGPHEFYSVPDGGHGFDGHGLDKPDVAEAFKRVENHLKRYA